MIRVLSLILLMAVTVTGCAPTYIAYNKKFNEYITIGTEDTRIIAEDGSFEWVTGGTYSLPANIQNSNWYFTNGVTTESFQNMTQTMYDNSLKVRVETPYASEPLYGLLQIGSIYEPCKGATPETRSYYIQVPANYVAQATGGRMSVVYESYKCASGYWDNGARGTQRNYTTWVLWISDRPISK